MLSKNTRKFLGVQLFLMMVFLLIVFAPSLISAQDNQKNPLLPPRERFMQVGLDDIGTYQQAVEESAKKAAEEAALKQKAESAQKYDIGLEIGKVLLGVERSAAKAFSGAKNWISSKIKRVPEKVPLSEEAEGPAIIKPIILMFRGLRSYLQSKELFPSAPESLPPLVPGVGRAKLGKSLSELVPKECRSDFYLCDTCPRLSSVEASEKIDFSASCEQCIQDNYSRLQKCKLELKKKRLELSENELKKKRLELLERALGKDMLELLENARKTLRAKIPPANVPPVVNQLFPWDGIYSLMSGDLKCNGDAENLAVPPEEFVVDHNVIYVEGFEFSPVESGTSAGIRVGDLKIPTGVGTYATVKIEMSMTFFRDNEGGVGFEGIQKGDIAIPSYRHNPGYNYTCERDLFGERQSAL